jgi:hypothetical protein
MPEARIAQLLRENLAQEEQMEKAARRLGERLAGEAAAAGGNRSMAGDGNGALGDLTEMLKEELVEMARKVGIEGTSRMRKDELIRELQKRR